MVDMTPQEAPQHGDQLEDIDVISKLKGDLVSFRTDIAERNSYINTRDEFLYGDGLWGGLNIPQGFDTTFYNYLLRIIDIHTSQMMGQPFAMYSHYGTQDMAHLDSQKDKEQIDQIELQNRMAETKAMGRKQTIEAIIRDNGGYKIFLDAARTGGAYGSTLFQMWYDEDEKKIKLVNLESIQNWFPIWTDNNFRERIGDAYVWQISKEKANVQYGSFLEGAQWPVTYAGDPLINLQGGSSALTNNPGETVSSASTRRPMVTVIDYTGYIANVAYDKKGNFIHCDAGKETKLSFRIVGDKIVKKITKEDRMPYFYYIPNLVVPRRPYGESNIPQSALDINQTILQLKSDQVTLANKELFPILKGKNYENGSLPARKQRETSFIPMQADQDVEVLQMPTGNLQAYDAMINDRMNDLLAVTGVPKILFYDPESNPSSSQAMLTSMRPMIDMVEQKQKNWEPVLREMFEDALRLAAKFNSDIAELVDDEDDWYLYTRWPNVLRKEDPAHQAMLINDLRAGVKSVATYMEERGYLNPDQEIDRIGQDLKDKVRAAILGGRLSELAQFTIYESLGIPLYGFNQPKITLKGDLTPQQEANIGANQGWNGEDQPYGASLGPQGAQGQAANDNWMNQGLINGNAYEGGTPTGLPNGPISPGNPGGQAPAGQAAPAQGQAAPIMTPMQNNQDAQPMSMPGSGATTTSAVGEVKHHNQNRGK